MSPRMGSREGPVSVIREARAHRCCLVSAAALVAGGAPTGVDMVGDVATVLAAGEAARCAWDDALGDLCGTGRGSRTPVVRPRHSAAILKKTRTPVRMDG